MVVYFSIYSYTAEHSNYLSATIDEASPPSFGSKQLRTDFILSALFDRAISRILTTISITRTAPLQTLSSLTYIAAYSAYTLSTLPMSDAESSLPPTTPIDINMPQQPIYPSSYCLP